jgi:multiple sugar transport system ATP-binding protein
MAGIVVRDLHKSFGAFNAVQCSNFTVADGTFFVMLGPSGCGKTTTLRMIAGLELPTSGAILLGGEDVTFRRAAQRDIAFVFQMFALYPHMTVRQNIGFPLRAAGLTRREVRARVEEAAALLQIGPLLDRGVGGLSGGDRQRVALGRAMVRRPQAFMMDEPLGALDAEFRHHMCQELRGLHDRLGATTVYVTHDQLEAMSLADEIAVMNHGIVEQVGPPQEVYDRPATTFVAGFLGSPAMNLLPAAADGLGKVTLAGLAVPAQPAGAVPAGPVTLGVRPEHVALDDAADLRGGVVAAEYLGTTQLVTVDSAAGRLIARIASAIPARVGDQVGLRLTPGQVRLFDATTGRTLDG